jgi:serine protease Do
MKMKQVLATVLISSVTTMGLIFGYHQFTSKAPYLYGGQEPGVYPANYKLAGINNGSTPPGATDFTLPATAALPAVVHIKTKTNARQVNNNLPRMPRSPFGDMFGDDLFEQFFGGGMMRVIPEQKASGSGVIIGDDGFIVTNNHVIDNADEITVTLNNKKTYAAKVIGSDPSYDLAVIKIEAKEHLPYLVYGNSDEVKIGQWVLAIGYPLNLETTVTAGIVSAKARSLGLNKDKNGNSAGAVESFIQTDAAVNMGNSGGALVNTDGKLIGVNSAIASPTGYYSGYSYAIPVNIVKKVVDDIIRYGTVQRGYLGIQYSSAGDLTPQQKVAAGIPETAYDGIYATEVTKDGGAYAAGIRKGDKIEKVNGVEISGGGDLQDQVSRFKPGDKINVMVSRNGKELPMVVTLKNRSGNYDIVKKESTMDKLGADFNTLDAERAKDYGVKGGVVVKKINKGAIFDQTRMKDGFVILRVNDQDVTSIESFNKAIKDQTNITMSGFYPGYDGLYEYPISIDQE